LTERLIIAYWGCGITDEASIEPYEVWTTCERKK